MPDNEPPAMVIQTIESLAALDYPNLEVIVIDNNTKDPAVWRPVQDYCAQLGDRSSIVVSAWRTSSSAMALM